MCVRKAKAKGKANTKGNKYEIKMISVVKIWVKKTR